MSLVSWSDVMRVGCPYCGASSREPCITKSGADAKEWHMKRVWLAQRLKERA